VSSLLAEQCYTAQRAGFPPKAGIKKPLRACSNCGFLRSIDRKNPDFRALSLYQGRRRFGMEKADKPVGRKQFQNFSFETGFPNLGLNFARNHSNIFQ
jgi:hypothetical protein